MYYVRAAALLAVLGSVIAFTGCSGGGSGLTPSTIPAAPGSQNPAVHPSNFAIEPSESSLSLVQGPIVLLQPNNGYQINAGGGVGYINVVPNSETHEFYGGLTPKVGEYVELVTSSPLNGKTLTPLAVSLYSSSPPSGTLTGTVMSTQPYGVAIKLDSNGSYVAVGISSSTGISGSIAVGQHISSSGAGSATTASYPTSILGGGGGGTPTPAPTHGASPTPAPTSTPSGGVPQHLITADYFEGLYGTTKVSPSQAAPYLTWAQTAANDAPGIKAAGIHTQIYLDPNRVGTTDPLYGYLNEGDFAHTCSNGRITIGGSQYVTNFGNAGMVTAANSYLTSKEEEGPIDNVFVDNGGALSAYDEYSKISPGMPCGYTDAEWTAQELTGYQLFNRPIVVNGLEAFTSTGGLSPVLALLADSNVQGGDLEGCYSDEQHAIEGQGAWPLIENTEITVNNEAKTFECMARDQEPANASYPERIFNLASFLMTYNPNYSIYAEEYATPDDFHVFPESGLVALDPLVPEPTDAQGIGALQTPTGAYGREYGACYMRGSYVGKCAVAVSRDYGSPHNFPFSGYTRTLTLSGNGVLDGGTASTNGPPPPSVMEPYTAVIAFK